MNVQKKIQLLDCTLRDGGHLNAGNFGKEVITNVINKLVEARVDIVELGFIWETPCDENIARYHTIQDVKRILPKEKGNTKYSLMADFIDLEHLEPCDGTVDIIRLSFKRPRLEWALQMAHIVMDKGYKVFINPVNCNVYTDEEYIEVIRKVNELQPYGFCIVDTFGVMRLRDLTYRYSLVEKNLDPNIVIGLHLHENLGLAYSLAQQFIRLASPKRKIVIDGSLLGMGRVPGNLCIEQIMDHLNTEYENDYNVEPAFDAIDDYISPIKKKIFWGYAIPYALSAKYNLHRTYAEFLMNKWKLRTSDIERILSMIESDKAENFDESYVEQLYRKYISVDMNDDDTIKTLRSELVDRNILLIAPGTSIIEHKDKIIKYIKEVKPVIIGIHCAPEAIKLDYIFFSNVKRYDVLNEKQPDAIKIVTSNLVRYSKKMGENVIKYASLAYHGEDYCEDSVLMVLNLLNSLGIEKVALAGFDGFETGEENFYISNLARSVESDVSNRIKYVLNKYYREMQLYFLTDSCYEDYKYI